MSNDQLGSMNGPVQIPINLEFGTQAVTLVLHSESVATAKKEVLEVIRILHDFSPDDVRSQATADIPAMCYADGLEDGAE